MQDFSELREKFRADGVVRIKNALDGESMRLAEAAYNWSLEHPGPGAAQFQNRTTTSGKFYQDLANPNAMDAYRELLEKSPAGELVAKLWGTDNVWFFYEQVFLKEGGDTRRTPWHQDASYLPIEGDQLAVMWISFDAVPKENALEFVRGSHRGVLYDGSRFDAEDDTAPIYGDGKLPRLPDIEAARDKFDIVSWAVEPGDVLVFHTAMLHGGAATRPGARRRTLSLRFFGDHAVFAARPGYKVKVADDTEPRNVFEDLNRRLRPGAPFRHPKFPRIWPRA